MRRRVHRPGERCAPLTEIGRDELHLSRRQRRQPVVQPADALRRFQPQPSRWPRASRTSASAGCPGAARQLSCATASLSCALLCRRTEREAWPDLSDAALAARQTIWLAPFIGGATRLADIGADAPRARPSTRSLPWHLQGQLDTEAPTHFVAPTGNRHAIDYEGEGAPIVALRVQEVFGLKIHPAIAGGRLPLTLHLLSPASRPVQITRDLPGLLGRVRGET